MRWRSSPGLQSKGSSSDFVPEAKAGPSKRRHCGPFPKLLSSCFYLQSISETCLLIMVNHRNCELLSSRAVSSSRTLDIKCDTLAGAPRRCFTILICKRGTQRYPSRMS